MAHLNRVRDVNDPWVINESMCRHTMGLHIDVYCSNFRLVTYVPADLATLPELPQKVELIQLAEYLWAPGQQTGLTIEQVKDTINYLRGTSHE